LPFMRGLKPNIMAPDNMNSNLPNRWSIYSGPKWSICSGLHWSTSTGAGWSISPALALYTQRHRKY
jgi:hypothetical protein